MPGLIKLDGGQVFGLECHAISDGGRFPIEHTGRGADVSPELLLENLPYRICAKSLETPAYQRFGLALRDRKAASAATRKFLDYLPYRTQREGPRRLAPPPL